MTMLLVCYPKCGTCKKAEKWLKDHDIVYEYRDISIENPTEEELRDWTFKSGLPLKKFFNTSGKLYRENQLSKKIPDMSDDDIFALLATNGMLVKRPVAVLENGTVLVGFKEEAYEAAFLS